MDLTFYEFLMRYRDKDSLKPECRLANIAHDDTQFPKQSTDFNEISNHLEYTDDYGPLLVTFDDLWLSYQAMQER